MSKLIQWPRARYWDKAWNPEIGCKPVSPACEHCWAREWARRFGKSFEPHKAKQQYPPRKGVVFAGNMTDLFGAWRNLADTAWDISAAQKATGKRGRATYLWLTKRPGRMVHALEWARELTFSPDSDLPALFSNQYFGFTAEDQEWFAKRGMEVLKNFPEWANLWVSMEPLLGPIEAPINGLSPLPKWVVVGCESGPDRRPCKIEWVEKIVEECMAAGVPVFVKQLDIGGRCVTDIEKFPEHLRVRQVPWVGEEVEAV